MNYLQRTLFTILLAVVSSACLPHEIENPFSASFADQLQQQMQQEFNVRYQQVLSPMQPELLKNFNVEQARQIQQTLNWHYEAPKQAPREFQGTMYEPFFVNQPYGNIGDGYYQDVVVNRLRRN